MLLISNIIVFVLMKTRRIVFSFSGPCVFLNLLVNVGIAKCCCLKSKFTLRNKERNPEHNTVRVCVNGLEQNWDEWQIL